MLFLKKKKERLEDLGDYGVFMAEADRIGYDSTGRKDQINELYNIVKEYKKFQS